jgi:hypothetical protein
VSTAKKSAYPLYGAGACIPPDEVAAGPVPAITVPLTLVVLATVHNETIIRAVEMILIILFWCFITYLAPFAGSLP